MPIPVRDLRIDLVFSNFLKESPHHYAAGFIAISIQVCLNIIGNTFTRSTIDIMMAGKLDLGSQDSLSSTSSPSSSTLVLRQREEKPNQRYDMQSSDIVDLDIRQKVEAIFPSYPSYPLLYLIYTLIRSNQTVDDARNFLENTHQNRAHDLPITSITNLEDVKDDLMRGKVEDIRTVAPMVTVWWAVYALQVCDGSMDCATGLLFENVVDASKNPAAHMAQVPTANIHSPSNLDIPTFGCATPSHPSVDGLFHTSLPSIVSLHQTPNSSFINISEDENYSATEDTATLSASPDSDNRRAVTIDKGKGVIRSDQSDYNSDVDMNNVLSFEERSQSKKHKKNNSNCKFCGEELQNWLVRNNHEYSCHMRTRQVCVPCKGEVSKLDFRRHESTCNRHRTSRSDGSEFKERDASALSPARTSLSRGSSPDIDSHSLTEEDLRKVERMREVFPRLTVDYSMQALQCCGGDVEEAIILQMDALSSGEEDDDRGLCSQQDLPLKRKSGIPSAERVTKRCRTQVDAGGASLEPAGQWIKKFLSMCPTFTTLVRLSGTESRAIPTQLMCDNSQYLKDLINLTGNQDATINEINLTDVEPALFDGIIQYMVCRNASFGPQLSETQTITSIVNFIVLAERLKVAGPATTMLPNLEAILKQDHKGPLPPRVLKVDHIHKIFSTLDDSRHPIRKLFVRASVRSFLKEKIDNSTFEDDSGDDNEVEADDIDYRNKPAHLAWKLNQDFGIALLAEVFETTRNRITRPTFPNSKNTKNFSEYFTDPLDDSQFTLR
ncbi:hypothetical protein NHQ30_000285 [Ciborinia camelliae]|nr:hypothetical protein NHQ30_000285 [Ciborinia camelliae]